MGLHKNGLLYDTLTGLGNYMAFSLSDPRKTFGDAGALLFLDLCGLKKVNEWHGHTTGDAFIVDVANLVQRFVLADRPGSLAIRDGGGSFLVVARGGTSMLLRQGVEGLREELARKADRYAPVDVDVRFSIQEYAGPVDSPYALLREGYRTLYASFLEMERQHPDASAGRQAIDSMYFRIQSALGLMDGYYRQAIHDDVSGLPNSRAANQYLEHALVGSRSSGRPFSVLFFDGDNLRRYNELGYEKGNAMISGLAAHMSSALLEEDRIFRWLSGDEFLVLLPDADKETAMHRAEHIRHVVEEGTGSWAFPVTISGGVATFPDDGDSLNQIILLAEHGNSAAKKAGKNRICAITLPIGIDGEL